MTAEESRRFQMIVNKVDRTKEAASMALARGSAIKSFDEVVALNVTEAEFLIDLVRRAS